MFDDTIEHEAWNDSDELRVVLIIDLWPPALGSGRPQGGRRGDWRERRDLHGESMITTMAGRRSVPSSR